MQFTISMLCDMLTEDQVIQLSVKPSYRFCAVELLSSPPFSYETLYIVQTACLQETTWDTLPECILCIGELPPGLRAEYQDKIQLLQVLSKKTPEEMRRDLNHKMASLHQWHHRLLQAVLNEEGLETYLNIAHEVIGNPMWIVDKNYCLLAYTKEDQINDYAWKETVRNGYLSFYGTTVDMVQKIENDLFKDTDPIVIKVPPVEKPFASTKITLDGETVALMNVSASHQYINAGILDLCTEVGKLLRVDFRRTISKNLTGIYSREGFLLNLLQGNVRDEATAASQATYAGLPGRRAWHLLVASPWESVSGRRKMETLAAQLNTTVPEGVAVYYQGSVACLVPHDKRTGELSASVEERLCSFLKYNQMSAAISNPMDMMIQAGGEFPKLQELLYLGKQVYPDRTLYTYKGLYFPYLRRILQDREPIESFCHRGILALKEYDCETGSKLLETLNAYLKCNMSPSKTAERLFIHRSTLNYRLNKIEEIARIDLNNSEMVFLMNLSLHLLGYYELSDGRR